MRHGNARRKLGKSIAHRRALLRSLATSLILREQFETTLPRAKELRGVVERLVTMARNDTVAARRRAAAYLLEKDAVKKLFTDLGPRYVNRPGGYTRVLRTRSRHGDAAEMAVIQFVEEAAPAAKKTKKRTRKSTPAGASAASTEGASAAESAAS